MVNLKLIETGESLPIMEHFYSIQGEGFNVGKPAYFIRIGGCDNGCSWCDVKESWDPQIHPVTNVNKIIIIIKQNNIDNVVITGGEPFKYNLNYLTEKLNKLNINIFIETSGTEPITGRFHWLTFSPKINTKPLDIYYNIADELKIIISNESDFKWAEYNASKVKPYCKLYLQPEWSKQKQIMPLIINYILKNPQWSLSLQIHKYLNIP